MCVWLAGVAAWLFQIRPAPPTCSMKKYLKKAPEPLTKKGLMISQENGVLHIEFTFAFNEFTQKTFPNCHELRIVNDFSGTLSPGKLCHHLHQLLA